jgi:hypothetical protein
MDVKTYEVFLNFLPTCDSELQVYSFNLTVHNKPYALQTDEFPVQAGEFCSLPPCWMIQISTGLTGCLIRGVLPPWMCWRQVPPKRFNGTSLSDYTARLNGQLLPYSSHRFTMNSGMMNEKGTRFLSSYTLCFTEKSQHRGVSVVRELSQIHSEGFNTIYRVSFPGSLYKIELTFQRHL